MNNVHSTYYSQVKTSKSLALGPQLGFRSVIDGAEGFLATTKSTIDVETVRTDENYADVIDNIADGMMSTYGTGSSSALFLLTAILQDVRSVHPRPMQLFQSLSTIDEIFQDVCSSLSFNPFKSSFIGSVEPDVEIENAVVSNEDDTDWFFDTEPLINEPSPTRNDAKKGFVVSTEVENDDLDEILQGLQHCLSEDWNTLGVPSQVTMALPMKLAMEVSKPLWVTSPHETKSVPNFIKMFSDSRLKDLQRGEVSIASHSGCLKQSLEMLHVHVVHGIQMSCCKVIPNSVMFQCRLKDIQWALQSNRASKVFDVIAVVCPDFADFGDSLGNGEGFTLGTSQQARSIAVQAVHTVDSFIQAHSSQGWKNGKVSKAVTHLQGLNVSLLLCSESIENSPLLDACREAGVTVLTMSRSLLLAAARLSGATIVENILELDKTLLGGSACSLRLEIVAEVPPQDKKTNSTTQGNDDELVMGDLESDESCVLVSLSAVWSNDPAMNSHSLTECEGVTDFLAAHQQTLQPVSVLLCATTSLMAEALKERFYRCLHRVRVMCENGGSVMPGAGVPEVVAYLRLEEVIEQMSAKATTVCLPDSADGDGADRNDQDDAHMEIEILKRFQSVLLDYFITVLTNNGSTYAEAQLMVDESRLALLHGHHHYQYQRLLHSQHSSAIARDVNTDGDDSILEYVRGLSSVQKCALLQPIRLSSVPGWRDGDQSYRNVNRVDSSDISSSSNSSSSSSSSSNSGGSEVGEDFEFKDVVFDVPEIKMQSLATALTAVRLLYCKGK